MLGIPHSEGKDSPGKVDLKGAVANAQQQRRGVVEAPLIGTPEVAVLDLVRQQVEWV